jgi:hypothetical protein
MEVDFDLGLGDFLAELMLKITTGFEDQKTLLQKLLKLEQQYQTEGPLFRPLRAGATSAATGNLTLGLGGPSQGRRWEIRHLVVGGATWGSTVAGTAEFYVSSVPSVVDAVGRNLADLVDQASGSTPPLPANAFYSSGQIVLRFPQELKCVIVGPTATTQYNLGGSAIETPDAAVRAQTDI